MTLMMFLKIIFTLLVCCPLAYVFVLLFNKMAEDVVNPKH